jgi:hypothetical protein
MSARRHSWYAKLDAADTNELFVEESVLGVFLGGFSKVPMLNSDMAWSVGAKSSSCKVKGCLRCAVAGVELF